MASEPRCTSQRDQWRVKAAQNDADVQKVHPADLPTDRGCTLGLDADPRSRRDEGVVVHLAELTWGAQSTKRQPRSVRLRRIEPGDG